MKEIFENVDFVQFLVSIIFPTSVVKILEFHLPLFINDMGTVTYLPLERILGSVNTMKDKSLHNSSSSMCF